MFKSEIEKRVEQENAIAEGIAMIQEAKESLNELAARYNEWIDQAAELGEDKYSDQLIAEKVEALEFARDLQFFEIRIREGAVSADAFRKLNVVPDVIKNCKSLLKKGLDMSKIGKQMANFKKSLDKSRTSLKDLRRELSSNSNSAHEAVFGKSKVDPTIAGKIEAEKKAREARLMAKQLGSNAVSPVEAGEEKENGANINDLTRVIEEEKGKK